MSFLIIRVAMSLISSKLCKFEINYALSFSIISGNTIHPTLKSVTIKYQVSCEAKPRKYQGVFEVKSRVKTWQVGGIWSQQLEH